MRVLLIMVMLTSAFSSCGHKTSSSTTKDYFGFRNGGVFDMYPQDFSSQIGTAGHYQGPRVDGVVVFGPYKTIYASGGHAEVSVELRTRAWDYVNYKSCTGRARDHDLVCEWTEFLIPDSGNVTVDLYANGRVYAQKTVEWNGSLERQRISLDSFDWSGNLNAFEIRVFTKANPNNDGPTTRHRREGEVEVYNTHVIAGWHD